MKTLQAIEKDVTALIHRLGALWLDRPGYGGWDEGVHVEVKDSLYHYVAVERGQECGRQSSANYDDLLYWIFKSITARYASYLLQSRSGDQDHRRLVVAKQIELMKDLRPQMGERLENEILDKQKQD